MPSQHHGFVLLVFSVCVRKLTEHNDNCSFYDALKISWPTSRSERVAALNNRERPRSTLERGSALTSSNALPVICHVKCSMLMQWHGEKFPLGSIKCLWISNKAAYRLKREMIAGADQPCSFSGCNRFLYRNRRHDEQRIKDRFILQCVKLVVKS